MRSAWVTVLTVVVVGCLDDGKEEVASTQSAVEPPKETELWIVSTGTPACDHYLHDTCPRSAIACLANADCAAYFACTRPCAETDDACFMGCRREHPAEWKVVDPFLACARKDPACR